MAEIIENIVADSDNAVNCSENKMAADDPETSSENKMPSPKERLQIAESTIISWILEEIKTSHSDLITIVCKDGLRLQVSGLLLAAISPNMARIFKNIDFEGCLLLMPEIEAHTINHLINKTFEMSVVTDQEILVDLIDIFWNTKSFVKDEKQEVVTVSSDGQKVADIDNDDDDEVKCELIESVEEVQKSLFSMLQDADVTEELLLTGDDNLGEDFNSVYLKDLKDEDNEDLDNDTALSKRRKKGVKRRKPHAEKNLKNGTKKHVKKEKRSVRTNNNNDDGIEGEDEIEEDMDHDVTENGENRRSAGRPAGKSSYVSVTVKDLPKDPEFSAAQARLMEALLDDSIYTDPAKLWFEFHGHSPEVRFSELQPKLICPICMLSFSLYKKGMIFFLHLQRHKYQNFKCSCLPQGKFNVKRKHIQESHWEWPQCHVCQDIIEPEKMANHLRHKHGQVNETSVCTVCGATFASGKSREFRMHLEHHKAEAFNCECGIIFKSKSHKVHHMQVDHVKEMLGCDKCYFVCLQENTLRDHVRKKHNRAEETNPTVDLNDPSKRLICDICGYECKSNKVGYLERHKARMHDPVILDCPHCPARFNASALKQHVFNTHESNGICNICGAQVKNIKRHMKNMHQPKHLLKYKCQFCERAFQWAQDIKKHVMNVHLKERPYKCRYGCEVAYNDSSNRNQHEKRKHGGIFSALKDE